MDEQKFIKIVAQPEISASSRIELDLDGIRQDFGNNLNTLMITNTDGASSINVYLDGQKIAYVTSNNGFFSFDWEFGINYNFLAIENNNAGASISAEAIKVFVGRSGKGE